MCMFEPSQKDERRAHLAESLKAYRKCIAVQLFLEIYLFFFKCGAKELLLHVMSKIQRYSSDDPE